jgi:hypothetical protein
MRAGVGKTTTMRMILGLDRPTAGSVTVNGKPFAELYSVMREVGALLDATAVHGGRRRAGHREPLQTSRHAGPDLPVAQLGEQAPGQQKVDHDPGRQGTHPPLDPGAFPPAPRRPSRTAPAGSARPGDPARTALRPP